MMRKLIGLTSLFFISNLFAIEKGIYGSDGRKNIFESPYMWQEIARTVAVMIPNNLIDTAPELDIFPIDTTPHHISNDVCLDEAFANEPTAPECSGFLVGPDLLVSAAHCMRFNDTLKKNRWVFDFGYFASEDNLSQVKPENVYRAVEVIERRIDYSGMDYVLVRLDREVKDRKPLAFRRVGSIEEGTPLAVIGSPSGLPLKFTDDASVRSIENEIYFFSNLDTFGGNSGSPVFNAITGEVEGILVRGDTDYYQDKKNKCMRVATCPMEGCRGEEVVIIKNIKSLYKE